MAKIEARLEANPQCKELVNPKTGATMPCPGPEQLLRSKATTPSNGVTPAAPIPSSSNAAGINTAAPVASASGQVTPATSIAPIAQPAPPCKPQINTKTGSVMPCPNG